MSEQGLVVVIPTRDRPDLARKALDSVLTQSTGDVLVLVSDNSTTSERRAALSDYCQEHGSNRVRYLTPPEPLPMARHWDWAMQQALSIYDASHFAFLTDRMLFKPGALGPLLDIIKLYPTKVLTYIHDMVDDFSIPAVVRQYTWTGNLFEVRATRLLEMVAQSVMYDTCMPRMLNCIVPRDVLDAIKSRFGTIFSPIAPDWNFCFRALELLDSILFYDKAALVHYAQDRSNGQSSHYGITNEAYRGFVRDLGPMGVNFAAPYPEIVTVWNAIISEYCQVKATTQSPKFPEINLDTYGQVLSWGIDQILNPERKEEMRQHLAARGWKPPADIPAPSASAAPAEQTRHSENQQAQDGEFSVNAVEFQDANDALQYALGSSRTRAEATTHQTLIQGVTLPLPFRHSEGNTSEKSALS